MYRFLSHQTFPLFLFSIPHQRKVMECPLCKEFIRPPFSADRVDTVIDEHVSSGCQLHVVEKGSKKRNTCAQKKCKTKLTIAFPCQSCQRKYCAKHRFQSDHTCQKGPLKGPERSCRSEHTVSSHASISSRLLRGAFKSSWVK